jgi:hypothetical protein
MPIYSKAGPEFTPAPAGTHPAVCVDVVDLGMVLTEFQGKKRQQHKIKIVWQLEEHDGTGKRFLVNRRYTNSLHAKATLRRDLESWRGRPFSEGELNGFDLEVLLGVQALLSVTHNQREGTTYANVAGVMKPMRDARSVAQDGYVRVCSRPESVRDTKRHDDYPQDHGSYPDPGDDDVPF